VFNSTEYVNPIDVSSTVSCTFDETELALVSETIQ
jgi:hypothetical protein